MNPQLQPLHDAFAQTLAPSQELIKQATDFLATASKQPQYGIHVLKVIFNLAFLSIDLMAIL